jgi:LacI family transcriptional regulator
MRSIDFESRKDSSGKDVKRIALLIERLVGFNHEVLKGIRDEGTHRYNWNCQFIDPLVSHVPTVREWKPDGIIAFIKEESLAHALAELGVPVVDVAAWTAKPMFPRFCVNDFEVGSLAAQTLLHLGLDVFAFVGNTQLSFSEKRRSGFLSRLHSEGHGCYEWEVTEALLPTVRAWTMGRIDADLMRWLKSLPKPIGVFADNDERSLLVSESCMGGSINIPEDVVLLGVDNDPHLTEFGVPRLSSIEIPARRIGQLAAELLNRLMGGHEVGQAETLVSPIGAVHRQSTDHFCQSEPELRDALVFIRDHSCEGIQIQDVVNQCTVSRRTLENLFRKHLRKTLLDEILDTKLAAAKRLLADGDVKLDLVAQECGFRSAATLCNSFKARFGETPMSYRRQAAQID